MFGSLAYIALTGLITIEYEDPEEAPEDAPADGDEESVEEPIVDEADPNDMGTLDPSEYLDEGLDDDDDEE